MALTFIFIALGLFIILLAYKGKGTLHESLYRKLYTGVDFPEDHFPARDKKDFLNKTALGYEKMKNASLIICGITRDDAETLPLTIGRIEKTGRFFRNYRVVIFENDSTDQTPAILHMWESDNPRVKIISESILNLVAVMGSRFERLAYCRNRCLEHINGSREFDGYGYIMVVDIDLRGGWSYDGLASSFFADNDWDAVASNSIGYHYLRKTYYDTLALKPRTILKKHWFYRLCGEGWQFRRNDPLIPVQSAFGGLGLYRREVFLNRRYSGRAGDREVCEHHAINADGKLRFLLNPSQITVVGTQEAKGYERIPPWRKNLFLLFCNW